jgi:hypothetical protein
MSDIRPGDIVDITYQETFESEQRVTHRCFVLSFKRRKSLTAALEVAIRFGGMSLKATYLIHSPKVVKIELVGKGSGNFRANLKHNWRKLGKNELLNPKLRRGVMKLRKGAIRRKKSQVLSPIKFDRIENDNIKKIL